MNPNGSTSLCLAVLILVYNHKNKSTISFPKSLSSSFLKKIHNLDFEDDLETLEKVIYETDQRIKKLEEHKEYANKEIRNSKANSKTITETLRRLERNLDELYEKRAFLIKERESKSLRS